MRQHALNSTSHWFLVAKQKSGVVCVHVLKTWHVFDEVEGGSVGGERCRG